MKTFYSIGEFSQVTGLSVKKRFYHERGILTRNQENYLTEIQLPIAGCMKIACAELIDFARRNNAAILSS